MIDSQEHTMQLLPDKYSLFFTLGTFLMTPELINSKTLAVVWDMVQFGLALDDCWDFGIDRSLLNGKPINTSDFGNYLTPVLAERLNQTKSHVRSSALMARSEQKQQELLTNLDRFESGIMLTENLALAIPYDQGHWPPELLDTYRVTDAMIWGAMIVALKTNSRLMLPHVAAQATDYLENPSIGLSRLQQHYKEHLLNGDREGREALSLGWQMSFAQLITDQDDLAINQTYQGPAYYAFPFESDNFKDIHEYRTNKKQQYLKWSKEYNQGKFSFTLPIAHLFQKVYGLITNTESWRSTIQGWKQVYTSTL